jgi:hypothetical protein
MNTKTRLFVALAICAAIFIAGIGAPAWADRLNLGDQAPAASGPPSNLPAASRPRGTVVTGNPNVTLVAGQTTTVGSCATVILNNAPADFNYVASAVSKNEFTKSYPGTLNSCLIKVRVVPASNKTMGADVQACFPLAPTQTGFTYYWDGTQWVKTVLAVTNGMSCIDVPNTAPSPLYTAMFSQ